MVTDDEYLEYCKKEQKQLFDYIFQNYENIIDTNNFIVVDNLLSFIGGNKLPYLKFYICRENYKKFKNLSCKAYYCVNEDLCKKIFNLQKSIYQLENPESEISFYSYEETLKNNINFKYLVLDKETLEFIKNTIKL